MSSRSSPRKTKFDPSRAAPRPGAGEWSQPGDTQPSTPPHAIMSTEIKVKSATTTANTYREILVDLQFEDCYQQKAAAVTLLQDLTTRDALSAVFEAFPELEALLDAATALNTEDDDTLAALEDAAETVRQKR